MPYFTEAELRDLPQMSDAVKYTSAGVTSATNWIESVIERKVGTSFIARTFTETYDGDTANAAGGRLVLKQPFATAVTAVNSNGVLFTAGQLLELMLRSGVLVRRPTGSYYPMPWAPGVTNITVTYSASYSTTPPADIKEAALTAARDWLLRRYAQQGTSDRTMSLSTEMGNVVYATANDLFRPTGIPDVDAVIMGWANRLDNFGFA